MNIDFSKMHTRKPSVPPPSNSFQIIDERLNNVPPLHPAPSNSAELFDDRRANEEQTTLLRLQYDFEFVQHLVSPEYIKYLVQKDYFKKPEFLNYLQYLKYWEQPEYFKLLVKPKCIDALNMLLRQDVLTEININKDFANYFAF